MSEFDEINDEQGWQDKLSELLKDVAVAARLDDVNSRFVQAERLLGFMVASYPNTERVRNLDAIAKKAADGVMEATIDERLKSIVARNGELGLLAKAFDAAAAQSADAAASIRLERVTKVIDTLQSGVAALTDLRNNLKEGSDASTIAAADKVTKAVAALRAILEKH